MKRSERQEENRKTTDICCGSSSWGEGLDFHNHIIKVDTGTNTDVAGDFHLPPID